MSTKINAKKGELVNLINGLFAVQDLKGKNFSLVVSKNIMILRDKLKDLETVGKPSDEFMVLAQEVNKIANENAEDSKEKIEKLEKDNNDLVKERRVQMDKLNQLLEAKTTVHLNTISEDDLPENITAKHINNLEKIIE